MRLSSIIMTYLVIGAVMWGGGVIAFDDAGVATYLIDEPDGELNENVTDRIESTGGPIQQAAATVGGGGLLAVWNLLTALFGFFFWPITTLMTLNAPPAATVLLGGTLSLGFLLGIIRIIATSI